MKRFWTIISVCAVAMLIAIGIFIFKSCTHKMNPWIPDTYTIEGEITEINGFEYMVKVRAADSGHETGEIIKATNKSSSKRYSVEVGYTVSITTHDKPSDAYRDISIIDMKKVQ